MARSTHPPAADQVNQLMTHHNSAVQPRDVAGMRVHVFIIVDNDLSESLNPIVVHARTLLAHKSVLRLPPQPWLIGNPTKSARRSEIVDVLPWMFGNVLHETVWNPIAFFMTINEEYEGTRIHGSMTLSA
jgi:hypothetical protein